MIGMASLRACFVLGLVIVTDVTFEGYDICKYFILDNTSSKFIRNQSLDFYDKTGRVSSLFFGIQ